VRIVIPPDVVVAVLAVIVAVIVLPGALTLADLLTADSDIGVDE
jgi:hypothetical protein